MSGKDKILDYCDKQIPVDTTHIENALENARMIRKGEYRYLNGCPATYGHDDYIGICEELPDVILDSLSLKESDDMCEACWKRALGIKEEEK